MTDSPQPPDAAVIRVHQQVVLATPLPELGLEAGDVGVVVHVHRQGDAFEVEFLTLDGDTVAVATLAANHVRAVYRDEIPKARLRIPSGAGRTPVCREDPR